MKPAFSFMYPVRSPRPSQSSLKNKGAVSNLQPVMTFLCCEWQQPHEILLYFLLAVINVVNASLIGRTV